MTNDIWHIIIYFFIYSSLGWVWETIYCSILERKFVYRGFLSGPYCPIYGFGVLMLLVMLTPLYDTLPLLFLVAFVVMSALEYMTSYVLEKVFHQRWWDYSNEKFTIDGRIALKSSLFWAVMSVVIVVFIQPQVVSLTDAVLMFGVWVPLVIIGVMLVDAIHTAIRLAGLSKLLRQVGQGVDAQSVHVRDAIRGRVAAVRRSGRPYFTERRLLRAFPGAFDVRTSESRDLRQELLALGRERPRPEK